MNLTKLKPEKYLKYLYLSNLFAPNRTKEILQVNSTIVPYREEATEVVISVFDYNADYLEELILKSVDECLKFKSNGNTTWINIDGLRKCDGESICAQYEIHPLIIEDILSINQRPKMEEAEKSIFCLLNMLYFNEEKYAVEQEQISIILT